MGGGYGTGSTTPLVASIQQNGIAYTYAYDSRGNIISETRNGQTTTYGYDALGQLIRVNDPHLNQTWVYNYDRGGNILSKVRYAYTTGTLGTALETIPYAYGDANWKDKLTAYNGKSITYDAIGNPLNDGVWAYQWQAGRQLKRMSTEGKAVSFKYNHNGLRTQKVVEADWYPETTNYYLHGKLLTHMTVDYRDTSEAAHQDVLHFFCDAQSRPAKVSYNGVIYTYIHNLQGDIVGLLDNSGALVVEYRYDAWGKAISTTGSLAATLGKRNPFRYRGYVYDEGTGLYYLRSRYYNPTVGRFVNADDCGGCIAALMSHNVYSYCANVPVMMADANGHSPSIITSIKKAIANVIRNSFFSMVDWVAQKPYAVRSGKMVSFSVSEKYISRGEEKSHNDGVANVIKWTKRGLVLMVSGVTDYVGAIGKKIGASLPSPASKILSTIGTFWASDGEDAITDFFADSFSIKQGNYTSICATFQRSHNHFIFLHCDNDYTTYEIRNYGGTYFELWVEKIGCNYQSLGPQKVAELDIRD